MAKCHLHLSLEFGYNMDVTSLYRVLYCKLQTGPSLNVTPRLLPRRMKLSRDLSKTTQAVTALSYTCS